ncbi:hypothetical protein AVEN_46243-1 [Araneus ventricosus]|uniref:Uncharacterized protein n=1 Tax=Araneus ventricosus TaxID=182803 RepID=A0A4Y2M0Z6_ARAVE|nr:hypothetical protein AVEN_46243-1 [Araneus ventricosus]
MSTEKRITRRNTRMNTKITATMAEGNSSTKPTRDITMRTSTEATSINSERPDMRVTTRVGIRREDNTRQPEIPSSMPAASTKVKLMLRDTMRKVRRLTTMDSGMPDSSTMPTEKPTVATGSMVDINLQQHMMEAKHITIIMMAEVMIQVMKMLEMDIAYISKGVKQRGWTLTEFLTA